MQAITRDGEKKSSKQNQKSYVIHIDGRNRGWFKRKLFCCLSEEKGGIVGGKEKKTERQAWDAEVE